MDSVTDAVEKCCSSSDFVVVNTMVGGGGRTCGAAIVRALQVNLVLLPNCSK